MYCSWFTDTQTGKVTTVGTLSWFQDLFLQPFIKDRPNSESDIVNRESDTVNRESDTVNRESDTAQTPHSQIYCLSGGLKPSHCR